MCIRDRYNVIGTDHIPTVNLVIGILCAMLVAMVLLGGIKRIGSCLLYTSRCV